MKTKEAATRLAAFTKLYKNISILCIAIPTILL